MAYPKLLTIQDISCVGQCSLTVALPILSACGLETGVLPSAVLSTHTAGFTGYTFRDLTDDMPAIKDHWVKEDIRFSAIYTGYLGSTKQVAIVADIMDTTGDENCVKVVDPAMADNGKLYPGFDEPYVEAMKGLCAKADFVVPNITESCFLTGIEYKTSYDKAYIDAHIEALTAMGLLEQQQYILTVVLGITAFLGATSRIPLTACIFAKSSCEMGVTKSTS